MNRSYSIAAIIFDMDGLMLDTERSARLGWETAFHEHGYHLTEEVYIQMLGRTPEDIKNLFLSSFGPDFPYESIRKRRMEITREFHQIHGYPTKEGLFSLIQFFRKLKLPLAVATSTSRKSALPRMQAAGLSSFFEVIVTGDEIEQSKPAPDIFLLAAERLNIPPKNCLVLEDSEAGILAAHRAGMVTFLVPDVISPREDIRLLATRVFNSLSEVEQWCRAHPEWFKVTISS